MKQIYFILFLLFPSIVYCQQATGYVYDEKGDALVGMTINLKGTSIQTQSSSTGQFRIDLTKQNRLLLITGMGFETIEVFAEIGKEIKVHMRSKISSLDEVQVIAYGTSTQRYNVGSVTKIKAEDIEKQPLTNPLAALQGRVPGLEVISTSGLPGSTINLQIRGQNTLKNNAPTAVTPIDNPLFIIDGVPFAAQNGNTNQMSSIQSPGIGGVYNNPYGGFSPFNSINPSDIESIEVLRDADATAIYGSRGGNGVILITTKKGKAGKTDFQMDMSQGISTVGKTMPMMNTQQYLSMRKEAIENGQLEPDLVQYSEGYAPDLLIFDPNRQTDWKEYFLGNNAQNTITNASLSGGTKNTQFRIGAGFNRNTYILPGDFGENRTNVLANISHISNDNKFQINLSTNYSYYKNNSSGNRNLLAAYTLEPNYPDLLDENGNLLWSYEGIPFGGGAGSNPLSYLKNKYYIQNNNLTSNLLLSYQIISGLKVRASFGYNTLSGKEYSGNPKAAQNPILNTQATANFGSNNYSTWIVEPQIDYEKVINKHRLNILVGSTFQANSNERTLITGTGYINDNLIESVSAATTKNASDGFNEYRYTAIFSRLNYRFDNKYLINLNARRDGSSRFGPGKQFGNFGSVGIGWLFTEEQLVKEKLPFLSYGKLRGSYGITGSDATTDYQYLSRWAASNYAYNGTLGYIPQNLFNPSLSWASTKKFEAGIELGFLKDKLLLNTTYYQNRSGNQLVIYTLPFTTGFNSIPENWGATVQNSGVEIMVQSNNIKNSAFSWSSTFNMTIPNNKLLSFPGIESSSYNTMYVVGKSLNTVLGFKYAGVNEDTGLFQFYSSEGVVTDYPALPSSGKLNDYQIIGNLDPKFFGGFLNSFSYKNFQLDVFIEFKKQLGINYMQQIYSYLPGTEMNLPVALLDRWQSAGDRATHQKYSTQYAEAYDAGSNFFLSDGVYSDASYIRFKTISLSYTFQNAFLQRIKLKNLRAFCNAQNLFTITNYLGNDPETQSIYGIPTLKTVVLGLQLTL